MDTEQIDASDGDCKDAVPDVEVSPDLRDGIREADVAVIVRHGVAEKNVERHELSHVSGTGEESLKAWFSRQFVHITKYNLRHNVVLTLSYQHCINISQPLTSDYMISRTNTGTSPEFVTRSRILEKILASAVQRTQLHPRLLSVLIKIAKVEFDDRQMVPVCQVTRVLSPGLSSGVTVALV